MYTRILLTLSIESGWEGSLVSTFLIPWYLDGNFEINEMKINFVRVIYTYEYMSHYLKFEKF